MTVLLQKDMADAHQCRSRQWDSQGIAGRFQEFTDTSISQGVCRAGYMLFGIAPNGLSEHAMSVQTPLYTTIRIIHYYTGK